MINKQLFLPDSDFEEIEKDAFGIHSDIAKTIVSYIKNIELNNSSFTLGLFGAYGSGKSYIINLLEKELKENVVFLKIDVWKYEKMPLLRNMLFEISNQIQNVIDFCTYDYLKEQFYIKNSYTKEKLKELKLNCFWQYIVKHKYRAILFLVFVILSVFFLYKNQSFFLSIYTELYKITTKSIFNFGCAITVIGTIFSFVLFPILDFFKSIVKLSETVQVSSDSIFSPEQFEEIFDNITKEIQKKNKKIVIVFDNLDRCTKYSILETLATIKTFLGKSKCFYIIPCDDCNINIENKNELLDKLFNSYIKIPILKEVSRDIFIENQLKKLLISENLKEDDISKIKSILFYAYKGDTPRQVKRFLNDLSLYYELAKNIDPNCKTILSDIAIFTIMIAIKQKWQFIEPMIINNPQIIIDYYSGNSYIIQKFEEFGFNKFLDTVRAYFNKEISLKNYVHLRTGVDDLDIHAQILEGSILQTQSQENEIIIKNMFESIISTDEPIWCVKALTSILLSIRENYSKCLKLKKSFSDCLRNVLQKECFNNFIIDNIRLLGVIECLIKDWNAKDKLLFKDELSKIFNINCDSNVKSNLFEHFLKNENMEIIDFNDSFISTTIDIIDLNLNTNFIFLTQIVDILFDKNRLNLLNSQSINKMINYQNVIKDDELIFKTLKKIRSKAEFSQDTHNLLATEASKLMDIKKNNMYIPVDEVTIKKVLNILELIDAENLNTIIKKNFTQQLSNFYQAINLVNYKMKIFVYYVCICNVGFNERSIQDFEKFIEAVPNIKYMKQLLQTKVVQDVLRVKDDRLKLILNKFKDQINELYTDLLSNTQISIPQVRNFIMFIIDNKIKINKNNIATYLSKNLTELDIATLNELFKLFIEFNLKPTKQLLINNKFVDFVEKSDNAELIDNIKKLLPLDVYETVYKKHSHS